VSSASAFTSLTQSGGGRARGLFLGLTRRLAVDLARTSTATCRPGLVWRRLSGVRAAPARGHLLSDLCVGAPSRRCATTRAGAL